MSKSSIVLIVLCVVLSSCRQGDTKGVPLLQLWTGTEDTGHVSDLLKTGNKYLTKGDPEVWLNSEADTITKQNADSAMHYADEAVIWSNGHQQYRWLGKGLMLQANIYYKLHDKAKADAAIKKAINILGTGPYNSELGDAYKVLGVLTELNEGNDFKYRMHCDSTALQYYQLSGEKEKQAHILDEFGKINFALGNKQLAIENFKQELAVYKSIHFKALQSVYCMLGNVYTHNGDYEQGLKYSLMAINLAEALQDTTDLVSDIYVSHAAVLCYLNRYDSTLPYYQKSIAIAYKYKDTTTAIIAKVSVAGAYVHSGNYKKGLLTLDSIDYARSLSFLQIRIKQLYIKIYVACKDYHSALPFVNEIIAIDDKLEKADIDHLSNLANIVDYYLACRQYDKVIWYTNKYIDYCKNYENRFELAKGYYWLFKVDSSQGRYISAISNYEAYTALKDSVFNENKSKQVEQIKKGYETEKKEQQIILLTRQSQLKQTKLEQVMLTRNIVIVGTVMLLLLLMLGYNRYRFKQRSNKLLEAKQREINQKNESLEGLLKEKEWLIKEIHHRVKNNLQIVMSLLNSQSLYLDNEDAIKAIRESQHRMHAMSLIHQKLYQSDDVASVDMQSYICELADYLQESFGASKRISFEKNVESIKLDVAQSIPIGLILNEAITNAIKYAFPGNATGTITIVMKYIRHDKIILGISDNGIGLPKHFDIKKSNSLGMNLIQGLVGQLGGSFVMKNDPGLTIEIEFPYFTGIHDVYPY